MRVWAVLVIMVCLSNSIFGETQDEQLWQYRNLGKAFYENAATQYDAVAEFKKALDLVPSSARERVNYGLALLRSGQDQNGIIELEKAQLQDPSIPHTWFNLGIAYKRNSQYERALVQLEGMLRLVPNEPITHYNLGVLYKLEKKNEISRSHFEAAARLDPNLAGPHFQLATAYRQAKLMEESKKAMATFRRIKAEQAGATVVEDLEWSYYSEVYERIDPGNVKDTGGRAPIGFETRRLAVGMSGLTELDANGDKVLDLLAWSAEGVLLYISGQVETVCGLETLKGTKDIQPGDFDNDGLQDLCVIAADGVQLYRNLSGVFERFPASIPRGDFNSAVWLDYDHDYDIDLFLLGEFSALYRNNGTAGFSDVTHTFPFETGEAVAGVQFDLVADSQGMDLAVVYANRSGVIYRDHLAGKYEPQSNPDLTGHWLFAFDFNNDGWTDLCGSDDTGAKLLVNDHNGGLVSVKVPPNAHGPVVFADFENRAVSELVVGNRVYRNLGLGVFETGETLTGRGGVLASGSGDFNGDGRTDIVVVDGDSVLSYLINNTPGRNWIQVDLQGVKNLALAPGAEIEVKAGKKYQKQTYRGVPLLFGLGDYMAADVVRITWPNGLIQNETKQAQGQRVVVKEAQRLSGSCPMIFAWNGSEFEFITDVLGVAPLGASAGDGTYFQVDSDEYVQISGESLVPKDGRFLIHITEELREVAYLDAVSLIVVDHPVETDIFTNEKFKGAPFPEFRLFGVVERKYPIAVIDHRGRDMRSRVMAKDGVYPDAFLRDYSGAAELHYIELDFGNVAPNGDAVLILSGWVDWADGSTFFGMSQQGPDGLVFPYLQVRDEEGEWQTVIEDMGLPAGKPKTISVDLTGKFLTDSREIRIVTSLCVYWDEIFLGEESTAPQAHMTALSPQSAKLNFRGFSNVVIHPERKQPEYFIYGQRLPMSDWNWNQTPGMYTRYGYVKDLLTQADDLLMVMGSGDEVQLAFDASNLIDLPKGWKREFLLKVDGWAKDGDANTAFSQNVLPMPYHAMPQYPYKEPHRFPSDGLHQRYLEVYQTRPALRFIRPLIEHEHSFSFVPKPE